MRVCMYASCIAAKFNTDLKKKLFRPATSSCAGPWVIHTAVFKDKVY